MPVEKPMRGNVRFEEFFRSDDQARDNYVARLFGLFNEEVVREWCRLPQARYDDLGRPYLIGDGERYGHTLDFTFRDRQGSSIYVGELKCELAWDGYRYLRLTEPGQLVHHTGAAFRKFLEAARKPQRYEVRVRGVVTQVDGAVLVWGATSPDGCDAVRAEYGLADVLSIENMIEDLCHQDGTWQARIEELRRASNELFDFVSGRGDRSGSPSSA